MKIRLTNYLHTRSYSCRFCWVYLL